MRGWSALQIALLFPVVVLQTVITSELSLSTLEAREWAAGWAALVGVMGSLAAALTTTHTLHLLSSPLLIGTCAYFAGVVTTFVAFYALEALTPD